jgi:hypothetical protein
MAKVSVGSRMSLGRACRQCPRRIKSFGVRLVRAHVAQMSAAASGDRRINLNDEAKK